MSFSFYEALHITVFLFRLLPAMHHGHIIHRVGKICLHLLIMGNQTFEVKLFAFINQRIYNIDLSPQSYFLPYKLHDSGSKLLTSMQGYDRLPAGWQFVYYRHFQIAIYSHSERAWYGSGCHYQNMWWQCIFLP